MTSPKQSREDRSTDQLLAGKYVLGLLSDERRQDVEMRMRRDRAFARTVAQWTRNMAVGLADDDGPEQRSTPRGFGTGNYPRLQLRKRDLMVLMAQHIWRSAVFWRSATLLLSVLVLTLIAA